MLEEVRGAVGQPPGKVELARGEREAGVSQEERGGATKVARVEVHAGLSDTSGSELREIEASRHPPSDGGWALPDGGLASRTVNRIRRGSSRLELDAKSG